MKAPSPLIFLCAAILGAGCDRAPKPSAVPPAPTTQANTAHPTTQELIAGRYTRLVLPGMPLSVNVPESWKIDVAGPVTFLIGPTPTGIATIQVASTENITFKPEQIDVIVNDAKAQVAKQPELFKKAEVTELGRAKLLERIWFDPPRTAPQVDSQGNGVLDDKGNLITHTYTPAHWVVTVYVPTSSGFARHQLNFMDLTQQQYEADRALLERIIRNVTYEPSLASTTAPAP